MNSSEGKLSILGHLAELKNRLTRSVIAIVIFTIISFVFHEQIFTILTSRTANLDLIFIEMTEMIGTIMRVSLFSGIILAMPYLTYQLIMFVSPALTRREKRYIYYMLPWIALMFASGVAFSYFILTPRITTFLITFGSDIATPQIKVGNYIAIVTKLLLSVGLVFEFPVVTAFLARIGVLKPNWLSDKRKPAIILSFILAAMITPTIDPINQCLVAVPLVALYEMSIWLAKLVYRRKAQAATEASTDSEE